MSGKGRFGTSSRLIAVALCCAVVWSGGPASAVAGESSPAERVRAGGEHDTVLDLPGGDEVGGAPAVAAAVLPGGEKVLVAEEAPPATRDRELVERRTANGKVFELSDGRLEAEIAPDPVHYRDGEGRWQEIDTRVAATDREGFGFGNAKNGFGSLFGSRSDRLVRFEVGQRHLVVGVAGAARDLPPAGGG